mmetsp:Transcript_33465/g.75860  ORF Transcript_33465/g.75860 Transcript_33465/m.75860 type:complete len:303 (+) Transcript_33465:71-979(+)
MAASRPVAMVTGGTRGIGKGISEALADQGFDLLLGYGTNAEAAEAHAGELRAKGVKVAIIGGDVAKEETVDSYFEALAQEFPEQKLKALVHNAGQYVGITSDNSLGLSSEGPRLLGSLLGEGGKVDLSLMDYYHQIYAKAWVRFVEKAVPLFTEGGSVVGISSPGCNCTINPAEGYDMPGSAKTVMETTARYYAKNLAPKQITVNVVIPGLTESDAWKALAKGKGKGSEDHSMVQGLASKACFMGRAQSARELGNVVAFLCGPHSRYITGVALPVDGGLHLGRPLPLAPPAAKGGATPPPSQ